MCVLRAQYVQYSYHGGILKYCFCTKSVGVSGSVVGVEGVVVGMEDAVAGSKSVVVGIKGIVIGNEWV